mmetsp:Transcript_21558/g.46723  ORF Transcript_21558/g.46723 Transcript_21558/m.46723 type:complete len:179 (-) Transcript_21558:58-594(-)|eukprot:CAMPEP_0168782452 /NCGR_PEP_ID=MMETSP0725-20121227/9171_1 /TAXON_ID=265536 /ORGANISM="Amphiprora sp., Strain CCMP467" /LENGTH=178 /DNA_ID=CAMNT_0008832385 /DNA_START=15 /DNA_END=551 /DNA_ORIENTATION=-
MKLQSVTFRPTKHLSTITSMNHQVEIEEENEDGRPSLKHVLSAPFKDCMELHTIQFGKFSPLIWPYFIHGMLRGSGFLSKLGIKFERKGETTVFNFVRSHLAPFNKGRRAQLKLVALSKMYTIPCRRSSNEPFAQHDINLQPPTVLPRSRRSRELGLAGDKGNQLTLLHNHLEALIPG